MAVKNKHYRNFIEQGDFKIITEEHIKKALENVNGKRGKHIQEGRALLLFLYYTGARPIEALHMKPANFERELKHLRIKVPTAKGGKMRNIRLPCSKRYPLVRELSDYVFSLPPFVFCFWHYRNKHHRIRQYKGQTKHYYECTDVLRYYFRRWFEGILDEPIPPYYLRHNRFSQLAEAGVRIEDLRFFKGGRGMNSVMPYFHMSKEKSVSISKKIR